MSHALNLQIVLLGNADAIVQHLCLKLGWDLPLDPRQKGALAQSTQAQAILGKRPSSSMDFTHEPEKAPGPTRVGDRYEPPSRFTTYETYTRYLSVTYGYLRGQMVEGG